MLFDGLTSTLIFQVFTLKHSSSPLNVVCFAWPDEIIYRTHAKIQALTGKWNQDRLILTPNWINTQQRLDRLISIQPLFALPSQH